MHQIGNDPTALIATSAGCATGATAPSADERARSSARPAEIALPGSTCEYYKLGYRRELVLPAHAAMFTLYLNGEIG